MEKGLCEYISMIYESSKTPHSRMVKTAEALGKLLEYYQKFIDNNSFFTDDPDLILTPAGYKKKIIFRNDLLEIIMLNWPLGSITPMHSHPNTGCWLGVVSGQLEEFNSSGKSYQTFNKWHISYREGLNSLHQLKATSPDTWTISVNTSPGFYDNTENNNCH